MHLEGPIRGKMAAQYRSLGKVQSTHGNLILVTRFYVLLCPVYDLCNVVESWESYSHGRIPYTVPTYKSVSLYFNRVDYNAHGKYIQTFWLYSHRYLGSVIIYISLQTIKYFTNVPREHYVVIKCDTNLTIFVWMSTSIFGEYFLHTVISFSTHSFVLFLIWTEPLKTAMLRPIWEHMKNRPEKHPCKK